MFSLSFSISLQPLLFWSCVEFPTLVRLVWFFWCLETVTSWQHCIDHNTTSAGLSNLGATPAVQVSGGQIPPSAKSVQHIISHLQAVLRPPCILRLLTQEIHRQMTPQDLSSQVPSSRKLPPSTPELLWATSPRKNFKTWCSQSSSEQKRSLLGLCVILDESVRHSPGSRGSAEGFLDVGNRCRPGTEEEGEEDVLRVPCIAWDIAQEMEWRFCEKHNLNLSHAWACNIMCDVRIDCAHLYRLKCGVWEVYLFTWTYDLQKASCAPKKRQIWKTWFLIVLGRPVFDTCASLHENQDVASSDLVFLLCLHQCASSSPVAFLQV